MRLDNIGKTNAFRSLAPERAVCGGNDTSLPLAVPVV